MKPSPRKDLVIGLVGPCKSGKTLLKRGLVDRGFVVKHIAQEHSYVKEMWKKIANPDILIYLQASHPTTLRRSTLSWSQAEYDQQIIRLEHAHQNADLIIDTNNRTPKEVLENALAFLEEF
jgi:hypothetical protein